MMDEIKDSKIEWVGNIPKTWNISIMKNITQIFGRIGFRGYTVEDFVEEDEGAISLSPSNIVDGKLDLTTCSYISWDKYNESPEIKIKKGDILLVKTASIGKNVIYTSDLPATINPQFIVMKNIKCNKKYLYYCINSDIIQTPINIDNFGSVIPTITQYNINHYKVPLPSIKEQKLIANFLDSKVEKIDDIINDLKQQVEIIEKYKKSLITETVTKGLNSNVSMKDSEIAWIGTIPEKWEIFSLKHLFKMFAGGDVDEYDFSEEYTTEKPYPIYSNSLENKGLFGYMSKYRFKGNTFTVTGRGDIGKAVAREEAFFPIVRLLVCIPNYYDDTRYFAYCVNSADLLGEQTAMAQLTTQKLGLVKVPRPSKEEQIEIANYLDKQCAQIDEIIKDKQNQIDKMEKYKKSLIYEYVTGKKRVKGAEELYA